MKLYEQARKEAANLGALAGEGAAGWIEEDAFGGIARDVKAGAREFLRRLEGCEALPFDAPNLSGVWAGDETPHSLMESIFGDDLETLEDAETGSIWELQDSLAKAWEDAATEAFWGSLEKAARAYLDE